MVKKHKVYTVGAFIKLWVGTEIGAESLEEAIAKAKSLQVDDFVTILNHGEYNDSSMKIVQVFDPAFDVSVDA